MPDATRIPLPEMEEKKEPSLYREDDEERGHIPVMTNRMLALRAAQLVLAAAYVALDAFAAVRLQFGSMPAFVLSFVASSLLVVYFAWLGYSIVRRPKLYRWVAHLTLEILTNLAWLASWAMLAVLATGLNEMPDGAGAAQENLDPLAGTESFPRGELTQEASIQAQKVSDVGMSATRYIVAAASGVGMLAWGLLTASLISTAAGIVEVRKRQKEKESEPVQEIIPESSFDFD